MNVSETENLDERKRFGIVYVFHYGGDVGIPGHYSAKFLEIKKEWDSMHIVRKRLKMLSSLEGDGRVVCSVYPNRSWSDYIKIRDRVEDFNFAAEQVSKILGLEFLIKD